jgi:hypothetical protein
MAPGLVARMVVGFVLAVAGMADAARRPVAVIDLTESKPATALASDLHKALTNHPDLQPLDNPVFSAALQGDFADENANNLAKAREYKQFADDALAQLDDEGGRRNARAGMDVLTYVHPTDEMLGLYAELAFAYGQAQIGLRKPNEASLAFQLAHRIDPNRRPDPTRYEPNIIAAYKAAAAKATIPAKLVVRGTGRAMIDGIEQGPAGAQYETTEGMHLVQLFGPDRETRGELVLVPSSMPLNIQDAPASDVLKVKRARIALARARDPAERASMMKKLAALLGVGDAVLIAKDGNALTVQTWRNREPGFSARVVHKSEPPIDLLTPLAPPRVAIEKRFDPFQNPPPVVVEKRWYQKNWVRASIAGGVIAGVVGAVLYSQRDKTLPPIDMNPTWKDTP